MSTEIAKTKYSDLEEETLATKMATVNPAIKFADLSVPHFMISKTHATKLSDFLRFEKQGEMYTDIVINADPIYTDGVLEPSVYGRRMKAVYAAISCFTGDIALATESEVILAYNPKLPYVEKCRYTRESKAGEYYWLEWNRIRGEYVKSGRKQFGVDDRVRTSGIRLPQTVINELDGITSLIITGFSISVGVQDQDAFADWLHKLITEGKTVAEYLAERQERYNAKNLNKTIQSQVKKDQKTEIEDYGYAVVNGSAVAIEMVPDGQYTVKSPGAAPTTFTLDKSLKDSKNRMRLYSQAGGSFTSK